MVKNEDERDLTEEDEGKVRPAELGEEMRDSFLEYAMSVIIARALPDVRDGLKPVHRRILYAMNEAGLMPNRPHKKSAWTVGEVIGKYHPHGDVAVYDTMCRLAQDFSMRVPLVDGHGNFGSVDGDSPAAMRYTEARLQKAALELLRDLDKDTVDFGPNYDESLQEPLVLPSRFPNLLVNGSAGIAVGMATNIPPHNLGETIDAVSMLIDNPDATTEDLMTVLPGPDFPTGGIIMGKDGIKDAYETGRGSITVRAKTNVETTTTGKTKLIVTELPYQVNKAKLHEKIAELARDKKIPDITGIRDESDRKGMRLVIDIKKDGDPNVVLNNLYMNTQMQSNFGVIMLALVDNVPRTLSLKEILQYYIAHQQEVIVRRTKYDLKKAEERAHILRGLLIAIDNIDEVIHIIRSSKDDQEAGERLRKRFDLDKAQTDAILEMRLRRLTGLERDKVVAELADLEEKIAYYKRVLGDPNLVNQIIKDESAEIKQKYGNRRRTRISGQDAKIFDQDQLVADEDMVVTISQAGYVKRLPVATWRSQKRGGKGMQGAGLKDNDLIVSMFIASTLDYVLFFSTKGKVYRLKVYELPLLGRYSKGTSIVNLLPFEADEKIAATINMRKFKPDDSLMFATEQGMVKKTLVSAYERSRRDGIIAINLKDGDSLIAVRKVQPGDKVIMLADNGKAIKWDESEARPMGRDTMGVKGMALSDNTKVIDMGIAHAGSELFVITENGYGKRTPIDDYPEHHRGGQGVLTIKMTSKKGPIIGMKVVRSDQELMISSKNGVMIRLHTGDISMLGRSTQGVKVMNMNTDDHVTAIAVVAGEKKKSKVAQVMEGQESLLVDVKPDEKSETTNEEEEFNENASENDDNQDDDILDDVEDNEGENTEYSDEENNFNDEESEEDSEEEEEITDGDGTEE